MARAVKPPFEYGQREVSDTDTNEFHNYADEILRGTVVGRAFQGGLPMHGDQPEVAHLGP